MPQYLGRRLKLLLLLLLLLCADSGPLTGCAGLVCHLIEHQQRETFPINLRLPLVKDGEERGSDPDDHS